MIGVLIQTVIPKKSSCVDGSKTRKYPGKKKILIVFISYYAILRFESRLNGT